MRLGRRDFGELTNAERAELVQYVTARSLDRTAQEIGCSPSTIESLYEPGGGARLDALARVRDGLKRRQQQLQALAAYAQKATGAR